MNEPTPNPQEMNALMAVANLQRQVKTGANNYYWIAGLSIINSLGALFDLGINFVIGLGLTQVIDGIAYGIAEGIPEANTMIRVFGMVASISVSALFVLFGYFAVKGHRWAFIVGMVLYSLDALLALAFQDWFGFGFHLFLLWGVYGGFKALKALQSLLSQKSEPTFEILS